MLLSCRPTRRPTHAQTLARTSSAPARPQPTFGLETAQPPRVRTPWLCTKPKSSSPAHRLRLRWPVASQKPVRGFWPWQGGSARPQSPSSDKRSGWFRCELWAAAWPVGSATASSSVGAAAAARLADSSATASCFSGVAAEAARLAGLSAGGVHNAACLLPGLGPREQPQAPLCSRQEAWPLLSSLVLPLLCAALPYPVLSSSCPRAVSPLLSNMHAHAFACARACMCRRVGASDCVCVRVRDRVLAVGETVAMGPMCDYLSNRSAQK